MAVKWRVLLLDTKKENPNHYIALAIFTALKQHPDTELVVRADYGNALSRARHHRCNLLFAFDGEELEPAICRRLAAVCGRSIVWYVEDPYEFEVNKRNAGLFDLVFTNDAHSVSGYGPRAHHLPLAACPDLHYHAVREHNHRYDLFFAGTAWPNRVELLQKIERDIGNIRLKLALPANEHLPAFRLRSPASFYTWRTPNTEFARFANSSAMVLSLHRRFSASGGRAESSTPGPRLFEVGMAGGFQLIDRRIPGVDEYLVEGRDYAAFSGPGECIDQVKHYLSSPVERMQMAISCQRKIQEAHTYLQRVQRIFGLLEDLPEKTPIGGITDRTRILIVCHNTWHNPPFGGVETYIETVRTGLSEQFELYFHVPDRSIADGRRYLLLDAEYRQIEKIVFDQAFPVASDYMLSCPQRENAFASLLERYSIDLVHFQHLLGHVPSLPYIASAMGVPSIFSMHDYYPISHRFNLIDHTGRYRKHSFSSLTNMDICLREAEGISPGSQASRMAFWGRMLAKMSLIHVNSAATGAALLKAYPQLEADRVEQCGIPFDDSGLPGGLAADPHTEGPLEILVMGNFTLVKGADSLLRVFDLTRESRFRFHVHGRVDQQLQMVIEGLEHAHVVFHGEYSHRELANVLGGKHVSLHLSAWPETYCITLSECWHAGIVPVVTDIGALGERVNDGVNGFKCALDDIGAVVDILLRLESDRDLLARTAGNISSVLYTRPRQHVEWLAGCYREICGGTGSVRPDEPSGVMRLDLKTCGVRLNNAIWAQFGGDSPVGYRAPVSFSKLRVRDYPFLGRVLLNEIRQRGFRSAASKVARAIRHRI